MVKSSSKIKDKSAIIGIIGMGYVGLPLACAFANVGFKVTGFEDNRNRVASINKGKSYIADVSDSSVASLIETKKLNATTDHSNLSDVDVICICVPTPITKTKEPDLSHVINVANTIKKYLRPGQLVVLESTTHPGTTREVVKPILEKSGLNCGLDYYLAYSPERTDPGNKKFNISNTPKVVGGVNENSTDLTCLLYQQVAEKVVPVSSPDIAEMTKLFENVFRGVNIALVNEMSELCEKMGISVWEVIEAASTKPFGYMPFYPGPGIGGHCIPLDPYYLATKAREYDFHTKFIELAASINDHVPYHVAYRIAKALNSQSKSMKGSTILVMGISYKKDSCDIRESPSVKIIELLKQNGARVLYNDPHVPEVSINGEELKSRQLTDELLSESDCVVLATDHSLYDYKHIVDKASLVFDSRGVTRNIKSNNLFRLGE
jgi:UDP-N-acetyl-D-glucosamine dehydrogenase